MEHCTFSGGHATQRGQQMLYVTERCVFKLGLDGLELIEVAPGIDIGRDILGQMDFTPLVHDPRPMDARLFRPVPIGLRQDLLERPLPEHYAYDPGHRSVLRQLRGVLGGTDRLRW